MERKKQGLPYASVEWDPLGSPRSLAYSETYFSSRDPLAERSTVFLQGNGLPLRWHGKKRFCIGELGFGSGLSFLLTCKLWRESAPPSSTLDYFSFEAAPLAPDSIRQVHSRWPEHTDWIETLLRFYPLPLTGHHRLTMFPGIVLNLVIGDARESLPQTRLTADCWFLDGFSPVKNPELWEYPLLSALTERTDRGGSLATYSVARQVRDNLSRLGWHISKNAGHPSKAEFLTGSRSPEAKTSPPGKRSHTGFAVIGGGIAGSAVANSIESRGEKVFLLEAQHSLADGASGNPAGILMPHISLDPDPMSRFYIAGFLHALRTLTQFSERYGEIPFDLCGVLRLASSERLRTLFQLISETGLDREGFAARVGVEETPDICGVRCELPGLLFPQGGWVDPRAFTKVPLERSSLVTVKTGFKVRSIIRSNELWKLVSDSGDEVSAENIIIANSNASVNFRPCGWFPLEPVRGQIISQAATQDSQRLNRVVCFDGYILPERSGQHAIGATYDHQDDRCEVDDSQSGALLNRAHLALPDLRWDPAGTLGARVSFRSMSRDRLPLLGPVPDLRSYEGVTSWKETFRPEFHPGLYVSVGHGSRGLISAHLSAEIISAEIFGEAAAAPVDLLSHLFPERYLTRLLKRGVAIGENSASFWKVKPNDSRGSDS